jgi:hypothetical protein
MLFPPLKKKWIFNLNLKFISNFKDFFYQITQDCIGYLFSSIILILIFNFFIFLYGRKQNNPALSNLPERDKERKSSWAAILGPFYHFYEYWSSGILCQVTTDLVSIGLFRESWIGVQTHNNWPLLFTGYASTHTYPGSKQR